MKQTPSSPSLSFFFFSSSSFFLPLLVVWSVLFLSFVSTVVSVRPSAYPRLYHEYAEKNDQQLFPAQWFTQTLDHYNGADTRTFKQKYYVNDLYWDKDNGPVFLYINGEGPVSGPPSSSTSEVVALAQKFSALIVTLEHRYYGESAPFSNYSLENLEFLSSKQALFDLAHFIVNFTNYVLPPPPVIDNPGEITTRKIFTIGGSYSGALAAWFRLKFPQITVGSVSSSGVVNAILDFTAFDEHVAFAAGEDCANALRKVTQLAEKAIDAGGNSEKNVKALFGAETLVDNGDFFYFLADSMAEGIQYGYHNELCLPLIDAVANNVTDLLYVYSNYTNNTWGVYLGTPPEYATAWQQNITVDFNKADRQWWYQTCTELAYFQNAPKVGAIRSQRVNMTYHRTHCENVFGAPLWPNTQETNEYYGGNYTAATRVVFANGSQDPWQEASITSSFSIFEPTIMVTCLNCGHCVDLRGCPNGCSNPNVLTQARDEIVTLVGTWLYGQ